MPDVPRRIAAQFDRRATLAEAAAGIGPDWYRDPPQWMPVEGVELLPCGRCFDALQLPTFVGARVISRMLDRSGPVIEDQVAETLSWLVKPGAADGWEERVPGVAVLGAGRSLAVPPASWRCGPSTRWLRPARGDCLTDPGALYDALRHVLGLGRAGRA
ncbi:hypothetical protein [Streptomyces litchfieldiae]|uniref:Uncharacterized protein n=1 Tax=Streptomyces litchfieldiae TaxID=3075543 RepID=A0ABU2MJ04_9ACTN|nr:hypothetical protein [Streptomyces sp. DSM 44938]MDT0341576.1 hypothetical protein [Streptomyces sp. DSM 44938]